MASRFLSRRDIEYPHLVAGVGPNTRQQRDVTLDTCNQRRFPQRGQPELLKGADTIRVPVENVEMGHSSVGGA